MKKLRCKTRILCLPLAILVIHLGCTHLPPISEEVGENIGTIGVITSIYNADLYLSRIPVTDWGQGCNRGAAAGAGGWAGGCLYAAPDTLGLSLLLLPLTPVAAIIGCIGGGLSTESESEVQKAEALLRNAISELNIKETLQYQFLRVALKKTPYKFVVLENIEFDGIKEQLNYSSLADKGVDTVVWIDISEICLTTVDTTGINPSLSFTMTVNIDFIRAMDGEVVYRHIWEKECDDDKFVDWADNNAEPLRKEFNRCCKSVAKQIVEDLFLTKPQKIRWYHPKQYLAYNQESVKSFTLPLRKQPEKNLKDSIIKDMLIQYGFFDSKLNPDSSFDNYFIDNQNGTITDWATGLMWEKNGFRMAGEKKYALAYVKRLNKKRFAGYSDWRMPTIEELASLLSKKKTNNLHIDPVFDSQQIRCWSHDGAESFPGSSINVGWVVDFNYGKIKKATWYDTWQPWYEVMPKNFVRAVRSIK